VIVIKDLCKSYGAARTPAPAPARTRALDGVSLTFADGLITGLLGANGAGKTTLLSILATHIGYDSGQVFLYGKPLSESKKIRAMLAAIPQELAFYEKLTVAENLDFFAAMLGLSGKRQERLAFAIETSRLGPLLPRRAATLSGGEKRRLNIAIGLLGEPKIILFDEPTVGLDTRIRLELLEAIRALKRPGRIIVYTSHYLDEIGKLCDEAAILHAGKVTAFFNQEEMRRDAGGLEKRFLQITERPC
jgi:ABC-2 type transport system ATP-binding protein